MSGSVSGSSATGDPTTGSFATDSSADLERLLRWEVSGGAWRVEARTGERLTMSLLRCDGGEEADRFVTGEPDVLAHVSGRDRSDD